MDAEKLFEDWMKANLPTAQTMLLSQVMGQTWWAGFAAGRYYQCENGHHCLIPIRDLKAPTPMLGKGI